MTDTTTSTEANAPTLTQDQIAQVRENWVRRGFSFETRIDMPGKQWHWETHEAVQLAVVVSGCLKLELEGETLLLEPGREVEIPFGAWHRASNPHKTPCEWIYGYDR